MLDEQQQYAKDVANFEVVTAQKASELLQGYQRVFLYIGRETCPYCRKFVPKLSKVAKKLNVTIYYLHSMQPHMESEIQALRDEYGVKTVPGFLRAENGEVHVRCDSSMSEEDIEEFIQM